MLGLTVRNVLSWEADFEKVIVLLKVFIFKSFILQLDAWLFKLVSIKACISANDSWKCKGLSQRREQQRCLTMKSKNISVLLKYWTHVSLSVTSSAVEVKLFPRGRRANLWPRLSPPGSEAAADIIGCLGGGPRFGLSAAKPSRQSSLYSVCCADSMDFHILLCSCVVLELHTC